MILGIVYLITNWVHLTADGKDVCLSLLKKLENQHIPGYKEEITGLKSQVTEMKEVEGHLKTSNNRVAELEAKVAELTLLVEVSELFHTV